ncbi:MAG: STAS domain-containing protein [Desulfobacterales bacterium]|nr:STAS domain-containing protein [Desulfobacterales bacterium]MBF0398727.1 STAS domain-containing protein [Desulfobacterales bacterium]
MQIVNDCLIFNLNEDLDDDNVRQIQKEIIEKVKGASTKGVIIDVSAVRVINVFTFSILRDTARMIYMLGAKVVFVGFKAGVASALVDLDIEFGDILTSVTMEDGFELLQSNVNISNE